MQGRVERDLSIENKLNKIVKGKSEIIQMYVQYQDGTPATVKQYTMRILHFLAYVKENKNLNCTVNDLKKILPADISGYLKSLQYRMDDRGNFVKTTTSYRALAWSAVNSFFKFLVVNGYLNSNPCASVKRPSVKDPIPTHHLEVEEIRKLNSICKDKVENHTQSYKKENKRLHSRDYCILTFFLTMGIRASALVSINLEDINLNKRTITIVDKGEKTYTKSISDAALTALNEYLKDRKMIVGESTNALFVSNGRGRITYDMVRLIVRKLTKEAGHEVSPHALRHTYGSLVYEKSGGDLNFTRQMLNHSNAQVTLRYINNDNSGKEKEIQKFMDDMME